MKHRIKFGSVFSLVLFGSFICVAQEKPSIPKLKLAGDPRCAETFGVDSCTMTLYRGKVVKVIDGQILMVILKPFDSAGGANDFESGTKTQLRLASISVPTLKQPLGKEAKRNLEKMVLGRVVFVQRFCTSPNVTIDSTQFDVGLEQIKAGFARFDGSSYDATVNTQCNYQYAEEKAKAEKRGVWKPSIK